MNALFSDQASVIPHDNYCPNTVYNPEQKTLKGFFATVNIVRYTPDQNEYDHEILNSFKPSTSIFSDIENIGRTSGSLYSQTPISDELLLINSNYDDMSPIKLHGTERENFFNNIVKAPPKANPKMQLAMKKYLESKVQK